MVHEGVTPMRQVEDDTMRIKLSKRWLQQNERISGQTSVHWENTACTLEHWAIAAGLKLTAVRGWSGTHYTGRCTSIPKNKIRGKFFMVPSITQGIYWWIRRMVMTTSRSIAIGRSIPPFGLDADEARCRRKLHSEKRASQGRWTKRGQPHKKDCSR